MTAASAQICLLVALLGQALTTRAATNDLFVPGLRERVDAADPPAWRDSSRWRFRFGIGNARGLQSVALLGLGLDPGQHVLGRPTKVHDVTAGLRPAPSDGLPIDTDCRSDSVLQDGDGQGDVRTPTDSDDHSSIDSGPTIDDGAVRACRYGQAQPLDEFSGVIIHERHEPYYSQGRRPLEPPTSA